MTTVKTVWDGNLLQRRREFNQKRFSWFGTEHFSSKPGSLDFLTLNNFCNTPKVLK